MGRLCSYHLPRQDDGTSKYKSTGGFYRCEWSPCRGWPDDDRRLFQDVILAPAAADIIDPEQRRSRFINPLFPAVELNNELLFSVSEDLGWRERKKSRIELEWGNGGGGGRGRERRGKRFYEWLRRRCRIPRTRRDLRRRARALTFYYIHD